MATEIIKVPDIGDIDAAEIIEITVNVGDSVTEDDTVIVLESDKASMELPASIAGTISKIKVKVGDTVKEGDEICYLDAEGSSDSSTPAATTPNVEPQTETSTGSKSIQPVTVPDIGGADQVEVIEMLIAVGDHIEVDQAIVVLESDKASMEVPSPIAGEIVSVKIANGSKVSEGDLLIEVNAAGSSAAPVASQAPAPVTTATATSSEMTVTVPDIGGSEGVEIIEILVKSGDSINEDDAVVVLESDKASMEVPSPASGKVADLLIKVGDKVSEGDALFTLASSQAVSSAESSAKPEAPASSASAPAVAEPSKPNIPQWDKAYEDELTAPSKPVHAGPAVRRLAREFGVDLAFVVGTGPKSRILKENVADWVKNKLREPDKATSGAGIPEIPDQDFSKFGSVETIDLNRIQQITAQNMARNWLNIPHVTQFDEADVTELEAFRQSLKPEMEKRGVKISPLAFLVKACASALAEYPNFNRSLTADGKHFVQKHYYNIGIAVDTPKGLIVPVIRDVDKKSVWQLAEEIIDLAKRGRKGQVKPNEMQGGCFTISSLGGLGGTAFTPIVNAPEVAILGISNNQVKPHWNGSEFIPRTFTPLSLSYDHRAVNGADAAKFTTYLSKVLTDIRLLIM